MDSSIQDSYEASFARLSLEEASLEEKTRDMDARLSGLKDIEVSLKLIETKLSLCLLMMGKLADGEEAARAKHADLIREKALSAFSALEGLLSESVSEDQRNAVSEDPQFAPVKEKIERFIVQGGGEFLQAVEQDTEDRRTLAHHIVASIRKYTGDDDRYPPLDLEKLPNFVRQFLLTMFPELVREDPEQPPYGIEEGESVTQSSERMKLPLSQAIFYMENELIPELRKKLAESPGDRAVQKEIDDVKKKVEEYTKMKFFPRSFPIFPEKGYYSEGMTIYSGDGEMMVPIPLPVTIRIGTNLDRKMELVRMELVRRLAGKGICPELDAEYKRLKSLESGMRGSSIQARGKLDAAWGFQVLKKDEPGLRRLEDKEKFQELAKLAAEGSSGAAAQRVAGLLKKDQDTRGELPPVIGIAKKDPG
jgi:hypothetical protein